MSLASLLRLSAAMAALGAAVALTAPDASAASQAPAAQSDKPATIAKPRSAKTRIAKPRITKPGKRPRVVVRRWRGYGFLPGYEPPDTRSTHPERTYHYWYYGWGPYRWPGSYGTGGYGGMWYRGRFSNGLGPCWTRTPIGPMWNCG